MATSEVKYLGDLRTECKHLGSGEIIYTDAPLDNKGKAEKFSPTDLVATAYAACMFTIMGIYCQEHGLEFKQGLASVTKVMADSPRRIGKVIIDIDLTGNDWSEVESQKIVRAGKACPVAKTLGDQIEVEFIFNV
jgi:uncharacterized OsmC-like protein